MTTLGVKPLDEGTWPDVARVVEKHNCVRDGCWCLGFHPEGMDGRSVLGSFLHSGTLAVFEHQGFTLTSRL